MQRKKVNLTNLSSLPVAQSAINQTVTIQTQNWFVGVFTTFLPDVAFRFWKLIASPFIHSEMQWIIIPLLLTFVLAEFYYFRHPDEELGWSAALINSLVLVFVAIDMIKTVFVGQTPWQVLNLFINALKTGENFSLFLVIIFIGGLGLALAVINYFHLIPRKIAYLLSSHAPINFIAYFAIVQVYTRKANDPLPLDAATVIAAVFLFTLLVGGLFVAQRMFGSKDLSMYKRA